MKMPKSKHDRENIYVHMKETQRQSKRSFALFTTRRKHTIASYRKKIQIDKKMNFFSEKQESKNRTKPSELINLFVSTERPQS